MNNEPTPGNGIDQDGAAALTDQDRTILGNVENALAHGRALKRWWEQTDATNKYTDRFQTVCTFNRPDHSFAFFDQAPLNGQILPVLGDVIDLIYDRPKSPTRSGAAEWMQDQLREFCSWVFYWTSVAAMESGHGVHQHGKEACPAGGTSPAARGALDPAIALLVVAAMHHPAPEHGEPQGPLGPIIGGLHPGFHHERPQSPHLPLQRAGKRPGFVRSRTVLVQQPDHPRIPGLHVAGGRRCRGPVDQPLQLGQYSAAKPGQLWVLPLRESPRAADQMRQTGLPRMQPLAVHPIAVADQDPGPARNQGLEGRRVPAGLHLEQRHRRVDHDPQPRQHAVLVPAGLINVVDRRPPGLRRNRLIHRCDRFRDPIDRALTAPRLRWTPKTDWQNSCTALRLPR